MAVSTSLLQLASTVRFQHANTSIRARSTRLASRANRIVSTAATSEASVSWETVQQRTAGGVGAYQLRPNAVPSSSAGPSLPTEPALSTSKRVLLYRDTNAWCPFCERVWLALEEKGIDYDTAFIDLQDKPGWFKEMVPTNLVPAATIDGELVWESLDILLKLEDTFPTPALLPPPGMERERVLELVSSLEAVAGAGYPFLRGGGFGEEPDESKVPSLKEAFEAQLAELEGTLAASSGPFLAGEFSLADVCVAPMLERLAGNLPRYRAFHLRANPAYPRLAEWYEAMDARASYRRVKADDETHNLVLRNIFAAPLAAGGAAAAEAEEDEGAAAEAAAKLSRNHARVVADILLNAGIEDTESNKSIVDACMLRLAGRLANVDVPSAKPPRYRLGPDATQEEKDQLKAQKLAAQKEKAVAAAAFAFVRNRVSAPRDMSAAAAVQFRAAADQLLAIVY